MELNYADIFKIPIRAMRINNCHPAVKRDRKWLIQFLFYYSIFTLEFLLIMYNIIFHNIKSKDFYQTCKNGVLLLVFFVVTFQYSIMLWKQDLLLNLMALIERDYISAKYLTIDEQKIMLNYAHRVQYVCKQWFAVNVSTCCLFPLKNIIVLCYHYIMGEPKLIPMYDFIYPGIIEEYKENICVYILIYAIQMFYALYTICMSTAFAPLGPSFMLHVCGQLEIVELKIKSLFQGDLDDAEEKLKVILKQLQYIYSFVEQILLSFQVAYELTLKSTTILLPILCYEIIEAFKKGDIALEFITFIVCGVLLSSSPCYYGDLLMEKGENVRLAIYSCGWESVYNQRVRSTIGIVLVRALRPIAIRTLFRTVCLEALTDLFQQSYAIFNLMNAMWK